jgi:hypothetical protein
MPFKIVGSTSGNVAEVDSFSQLKVALPTSAASGQGVGYVYIAAGPNNRAIQSYGPMGRLAVGVVTMELFDPIDGAAINATTWNQFATTMTIAQNSATGFLVLNSAAINTINTSCQITSIKQIQLINTFIPTLRMLFKTPNVPQANATIELGFLEASGTSAPTNGAFFRWSSASEFRCVTVFNSSETQSAALTAPTANTVHTSHITFRGTKVEFWIDEIMVAEVTNPLGNPTPTNSSRITIGARVYNGGTSPVTPPELHLAAFSLFRNDLNGNKLWPYQMASIGRGSLQSPVTAYAQTQQWANSALPSAAAMSNTAAAYTTLGGLYNITTAFTANQDNIIFGYQVPTGFQFFLTDVWIGGAVTTVLGATATALHWGLGLNASNVSLATTDSFTTNAYGPRRLYLGTQGLVSAAAVGTTLTPIDLSMNTPQIVDSGRFIDVILRAAASPATGAIHGGVSLNGYFE